MFLPFLDDYDAAASIATVVDSAPKAERTTVELPFVTDPATAARSMARRMNFLSFGSYRQTFDVPLPGLAAVLEPGKSAFLTHRMGADYGGYSLREVKILRVSMDLARLTASVETILREPIILLLATDLIRIWYDVGEGVGDAQRYRIVPTGDIDNSNTVFTLPETPIADTEEIFVNGILQLPADYTLSGATITFDHAPQASASFTDVIEAFYDIAGTGNESKYWVTPSGAVDGANADFELPETPVTDSERVYVNQGLTMQIKGTDYEMSTPTTIHFLQGVPETGDTIYVFYDVVGTRAKRRFRRTPRGRVDGLNRLFRLDEGMVANSERIFVNSILQFPTADYAFNAVDRFTFTTAPTRN